MRQWNRQCGTRQHGASRLVALTLAVVLHGAPALAQVVAPVPAPVHPTPQLSVVEEHVEVVGVTPIHGAGLPRYRVPANVQVFTTVQARESMAADVPGLLAERAASVQLGEAQAGTFQPDVLFRGFAGSPLLGASEGIAVYQDGVRLNDPFGDTLHWDLIPTVSVASLNLFPGSNPTFGLNALGGALSLRTKDGFAAAGHRVVATVGSFGRGAVDLESGAHRGALAYYASTAWSHEGGWRDFSPSTVRRMFTDVTWRGARSSLDASVTAASNDLTGNGTAPASLLDVDRRAVFTHPDRTSNDFALFTLRGRHLLPRDVSLEGVAYHRRATTGTFNGDAADDDEDDGDHAAAPEDDEAFDGVNNMSQARGRAVGATVQASRTAVTWGKRSDTVVGVSVDAAGTRFDFAAERAVLTADRGTVGTGVFDPDAAIDVHARSWTTAAFLTSTWAITDRLSVNAAARTNWSGVRLRDRIGTALDGDHRFHRVNLASGATYQSRSWLNAYGSYSQSSRVPTPVELTCADPDDPCRLPNAFVSDPPLAQVVARTWEAGVRGGGAVRWAAAVFTTTASDDIIFVSSGTLRGEGHFENVARTRRSGVESQIEADLGAHITVAGTYSILRATYGTDLRIASPMHPRAQGAEIPVAAGARLPGTPAHTAKASLAAMFGPVHVAVLARAQSGQFLRGDEANLLTPLPGFVVVSARSRLTLGARVSAVLTVQNLLGARYATFGALGDASLLGDDNTEGSRRFLSPGAPRAAWVGLDLRF